MTLLLPFREFVFGFLQLLLEGRVGVQRSDHRGADDARRIDIALPGSRLGAASMPGGGVRLTRPAAPGSPDKTRQAPHPGMQRR